MSAEFVDFMLFLVANLYNLLMVSIFLSRTRNLQKIEHDFGLAAVCLAIPLVAVLLYNSVTGRDLWLVGLPLPLIIFLGLEWCLDYLLKLDFRSTRWLGPYLLVYYLGLFGMIGYTFLVGKLYGFVTLATYFLNLFTSFYSYSRVRHGSSSR